MLLLRKYFWSGTNGAFLVDGQLLCYCIELPWAENELGHSCIPEGRYEVTLRHDAKFGEHLWIRNVPGRDLILLHPANDARKELKGCIAPVSILTGPGKGDLSGKAFFSLMQLAKNASARKETIFITIKKE